MILPCIGNIAYWCTLSKMDSPTLHLCHTFQKQSELSQYEIVTAQGRLKMSIPTQKSTRRGPYENVLIDYNAPWQVEHWRSINNSYRKSPFYIYYGYKIEEVYRSKYESLLDLNLALMHVIVHCLKLEIIPEINAKTDVYFSQTLAADNPVYPQVFDDKIAFEKNVSILDLIFNLGPEAKDYLESSAASV